MPQQYMYFPHYVQVHGSSVSKGRMDVGQMIQSGILQFWSTLKLIQTGVSQINVDHSKTFRNIIIRIYAVLFIGDLNSVNQSLQEKTSI